MTRCSLFSALHVRPDLYGHPTHPPARNLSRASFVTASRYVLAGQEGIRRLGF